MQGAVFWGDDFKLIHRAVPFFSMKSKVKLHSNLAAVK